MDRKLTEKEVAFLQELRELMAKHSAMLYSEDDHVCFDVEYSGGTAHVARWHHRVLRFG